MVGKLEAYIFVGNIGTGKSTYAKENLGEEILKWNGDSIREMFHPNDYIFSHEENEIILSIRNLFMEECLKKEFSFSQFGTVVALNCVKQVTERISK